MNFLSAQNIFCIPVIAPLGSLGAVYSFLPMCKVSFCDRRFRLDHYSMLLTQARFIERVTVTCNQCHDVPIRSGNSLRYTLSPRSYEQSIISVVC